MRIIILIWLSAIILLLIGIRVGVKFASLKYKNNIIKGENIMNEAVFDVTDKDFFIMFGNMARKILEVSEEKMVTVDLTLKNGNQITVTIKENEREECYD